MQTSPPSHHALATAILDVFPRLNRRLRADLPLASDATSTEQEWRDISELRTSNGQVALLRLLVAQERCTMQEIAEHLAVTPPTTTMMVKRLLTQGYVERLRDESDWRQVWVKATERGQRAITVYDQARATTLQRRLDNLSEQERASIEAALPALRHLIEV
jgi:MarR family transcriptional regulator, organic hydroperoxide resistance regulator